MTEIPQHMRKLRKMMRDLGAGRLVLTKAEGVDHYVLPSGEIAPAAVARSAIRRGLLRPVDAGLLPGCWQSWEAATAREDRHGA